MGTLKGDSKEGPKSLLCDIQVLVIVREFLNGEEIRQGGVRVVTEFSLWSVAELWKLK